MDKTTFSYTAFAFFAGLAGAQAYGIIFFVLFLCGVGLPIPEDITLLAAGFLAGQGKITFWGAMAVGFIGVLIGDTLLYLIGRKYGRAVFTWPGARRIFTPQRIEKAERKILKNARVICFSARFAPGLRAPIYLTTGILRVPFRIFFFQDGFAALISVPVWIWVGWRFADQIEKGFEYIADAHKLIALGLTGIVLYFVIRHYYRKKKEKQPTT